MWQLVLKNNVKKCYEHNNLTKKSLNFFSIKRINLS
jgi:hypothetical protein